MCLSETGSDLKTAFAVFWDAFEQRYFFVNGCDPDINCARRNLLISLFVLAFAIGQPFAGLMD